MLTIDEDLPAGVLLAPDGPTLEDRVRSVQGQWFCFEDEFVERRADKINLVLPRAGSDALTPVIANDGNGQMSTTNGIAHYTAKGGINCGLALARPMRCTSLSLAVIVMDASPDSRTIAGLNQTDEKASFYFTAEETGLVLGRRRADEKVALPFSSNVGPDLLFAQITPHHIALARDDAHIAESKLSAPLLESSFDLFIACRRQAAGLTRTLGNVQIADVFVFPDADIFAPDQAALKRAVLTYKQEAFAHDF